MSEAIKKLLGDELYNQVLEKSGLKSSEFDLLKNYIPKSRFNEVNEIKKQLEGKVTDFETQLNNTKKMLSDNEDYKNKYSELETKFNDTIAHKDKEITNISKMAIVESELMKAGAKHTNLLKREIDLESLKLDGDSLIGITDTINKLKTDYNDLFKTTKQTNNLNPNSGQDDDPAQNNEELGNINWADKFKEFI
jgi:hypothetical protein